MSKIRCSPHGWTVDTAHKHLSSKIRALRKVVEENDDRNRERFASRSEAVKIASDATKEASDKFAIDLQNRLKALDNVMQRPEYEANHKLLEGDLRRLELRLNTFEVSQKATEIEKRAGLSMIGQVVLGLFAAMMTAAAVATAFLAVHWR